MRASLRHALPAVTLTVALAAVVGCHKKKSHHGPAATTAAQTTATATTTTTAGTLALATMSVDVPLAKGATPPAADAVKAYSLTPDPANPGTFKLSNLEITLSGTSLRLSILRGYGPRLQKNTRAATTTTLKTATLQVQGSETNWTLIQLPDGRSAVIPPFKKAAKKGTSLTGTADAKVKVDSTSTQYFALVKAAMARPGFAPSKMNPLTFATAAHASSRSAAKLKAKSKATGSKLLLTTPAATLSDAVAGTLVDALMSATDTLTDDQRRKAYLAAGGALSNPASNGDVDGNLAEGSAAALQATGLKDGAAVNNAAATLAGIATADSYMKELSNQASVYDGISDWLLLVNRAGKDIPPDLMATMESLLDAKRGSGDGSASTADDQFLAQLLKAGANVTDITTLIGQARKTLPPDGQAEFSQNMTADLDQEVMDTGYTADSAPESGGDQKFYDDCFAKNQTPYVDDTGTLACAAVAVADAAAPPAYSSYFYVGAVCETLLDSPDVGNLTAGAISYLINFPDQSGSFCAVDPDFTLPSGAAYDQVLKDSGLGTLVLSDDGTFYKLAAADSVPRLGGSCAPFAALTSPDAVYSLGQGARSGSGSLCVPPAGHPCSELDAVFSDFGLVRLRDDGACGLVNFEAGAACSRLGGAASQEITSAMGSAPNAFCATDAGTDCRYWSSVYGWQFQNAGLAAGGLEAANPGDAASLVCKFVPFAVGGACDTMNGLTSDAAGPLVAGNTSGPFCLLHDKNTETCDQYSSQFSYVLGKALAVDPADGTGLSCLLKVFATPGTDACSLLSATDDTSLATALAGASTSPTALFCTLPAGQDCGWFGDQYGRLQGSLQNIYDADDSTSVTGCSLHRFTGAGGPCDAIAYADPAAVATAVAAATATSAFCTLAVPAGSDLANACTNLGNSYSYYSVLAGLLSAKDGTTDTCALRTFPEARTCDLLPFSTDAQIQTVRQSVTADPTLAFCALAGTDGAGSPNTCADFYVNPSGTLVDFGDGASCKEAATGSDPSTDTPTDTSTATDPNAGGSPLFQGLKAWFSPP